MTKRGDGPTMPAPSNSDTRRRCTCVLMNRDAKLLRPILGDGARRKGRTTRAGKKDGEVPRVNSSMVVWLSLWNRMGCSHERRWRGVWGYS